MSLDRQFDFDFIVIGSGFGGSVAGASPDRKRLPRGGNGNGAALDAREPAPHQLADSSLVLAPAPGLRGFFNMRVLQARHDPARLRRRRRVHHLCQHHAGSRRTPCGTAARGPDWPIGRREMPRHYETAIADARRRREPHPRPGRPFLKQAAEAAGVGHTFYRTNVAVFEPPEGEAGGKTYPDPYFGGEGPERCTCIACGGCMVGCRYNAKNSLDKNYLYLAEKHGARVFDETRVVDVKPLGRRADGSAGYEVRTVNSISLLGRSSPAVSPAAAWFLRLRRWAAWTCFSA